MGNTWESMCREVDGSGRHVKCDVEGWGSTGAAYVPEARPNSVLRGCVDTEECAQYSIAAANQAGRQERGVPLGQ